MARGKKSRSIQGQKKTKSAKVTRNWHKGIAANKSMSRAKKVRPQTNERIADATGI